MTLRSWLLGCLNSGMKQGAKLGLVILSSYATGVHLDVKTLATAVSVGFLWGMLEYQFNNPIPDFDIKATGNVYVPPSTLAKPNSDIYVK